MSHIDDKQLALFAGGDLDFLRRLFVTRHVNRCAVCQERVAEFAEIREQLATMADAEAALNWTALEAEMRANIRLGLEAGACVAPVRAQTQWNPRFAVAFASLCILAVSGVVLKTRPVSHPVRATSELEATRAGLELRSGENSLTLLNRHGAVSNVTVGAQGEIRGRFVDGETGSVTITNVYLEN
jgi:anti-sigma factor RsiW